MPMSVPYGPLLVVEDVPHIRDLLEVTLSFKGYPVVTARDGREALEKIEQERPALIISDLLMPNVDGFSLIYAVRSNPQTKNIPVILISATYLAPEDKGFAGRLGAVRFLEKPVDTDEFLLTIAEILTQGAPSLPDPLSQKEFIVGYQERLEAKLRQKNKQIVRTENLLKTLPDEQIPTFQALLEEEIAHRDNIQKELDGLYRAFDEPKQNI